MSTTPIALHNAEPIVVPSERSPLVAVAVAMAVAGSILASADAAGIGWTLLLFCSAAVYWEVRTFGVPKRLSAAAIVVHLATVASAAEPTLLVSCIGGAILAPALLLPLCMNGFVRSGVLWGGAAIGAMMGIDAMPAVLMLAAAITTPVALIRWHVDGNVRNVPLVSIIAVAAAIHPLF